MDRQGTMGAVLSIGGECRVARGSATFNVSGLRFSLSICSVFKVLNIKKAVMVPSPREMGSPRR